MEGCFRFQWGEGGCFSDGGGLHFLVGEEGVSILMGREVRKKTLDRRGAPLAPTIGNHVCIYSCYIPCMYIQLFSTR